MRTLYHKAAEFLRNEDGPTAVEYAVMLAMIVAVCFVAIQVLGSQTNKTFNAPPLESALTGGS